MEHVLKLEEFVPLREVQNNPLSLCAAVNTSRVHSSAKFRSANEDNICITTAGQSGHSVVIALVATHQTMVVPMRAKFCK